MQFWCSAEVLSNSDDPSVGQKNCKYSSGESRMVDGNEVSKDKIEEFDTVLVIFLKPSLLVTTSVFVMIVTECYANGFYCLVV